MREMRSSSRVPSTEYTSAEFFLVPSTEYTCAKRIFRTCSVLRFGLRSSVHSRFCMCTFPAEVGCADRAVKEIAHFREKSTPPDTPRQARLWEWPDGTLRL